jgi:hypothetical protein
MLLALKHIKQENAKNHFNFVALILAKRRYDQTNPEYIAIHFREQRVSFW